MKLKVLTLQFNPSTGGFSDVGLREFSEQNEVLSVSEQFFTHQGLPYWAVLLSYRERRNGGGHESPRGASDQGYRVDWRNRLGEDEKTCFDALRKWRSQRAQAEGIPPYLICTNRQVAQIAAARPATLAALGEIPGIGDVKLEKYGAAILEIIRSLPERPHHSPA